MWKRLAIQITALVWQTPRSILGCEFTELCSYVQNFLNFNDDGHDVHFVLNFYTRKTNDAQTYSCFSMRNIAAHKWIPKPTTTSLIRYV
jgi:hypothetical protein